MDEDDWAVSDEHQEEDIESNAVVAESALDRLACGLGGKTVFRVPADHGADPRDAAAGGLEVPSRRADGHFRFR